MNIPGRDFWTLNYHLLSEKWGFKQIVRAPEKIQDMAANSILVVASTALGDAILCTPLLRKLREDFPNTKIGFLVKKPFSNLFEQHSHNLQLHTYTKKYRNEGALISSIKSQNYQVALLANANDPDVVPLIYKSGVRAFLRRPTRDSAYRNWMANIDELRHPHEDDYATGHAIIQNLRMLEWLTHKPTHVGDYPTEVYISNDDEIAATRLLPHTKNLIGIHPGASKDFKRWPVEYFQRLIDLLYTSERHFIITGSPEEFELCEKVANGRNECVTQLAGKLTLRQLAGAMKQFKVFISGDTGPYHLAMAVGCPTLTWFSPTDKGSDIESVGPLYNRQKHLVIRPKGYSQAMRTISPESVYLEVMKVLS